jgi:phenylpyruvate tautomerase PptA (4-oxalocrotonate tautomerase family)
MLSAYALGMHSRLVGNVKVVADSEQRQYHQCYTQLPDRFMPVIQVTLIEGYDDDTRSSLCKRLTDAARATIAAPLDGITVFINEVQPHSYMRGRTTRIPGAPLPTPDSIVKDYLSAMESRDLDAAQSFLGPEFRMTFPGNQHFTQLQELVSWSKTRYVSVSKTFEHFDVSGSDAGAVVYCTGTLNGTWLDGSEFSGIRFVDRFIVTEGKIIKQEVWNDLGEMAPSGLV